MSLKVSKASWHYRLIDIWNFRHPKNLCAYFWKTVFCVLLFPSMFVLGVSILSILTYPVWRHFTGAYMGGIGFASSALWLTLGMIVRSIYRDELRYRPVHPLFEKDKPWNKDLIPRVEKSESINIAAEFIRAKKQKVCPFLEFVE